MTADTDLALLNAAAWQTVASISGIILALAGVVLAFLGIRIARATAREQREDRAFPSDKAHGDTFATAIRGIDGMRLLIAGAGSSLREIAFDELKGACNTYAIHVTGANRGVEKYMIAGLVEIRKVMTDPEQGASENYLVHAFTIDAKLADIREVAEDWVYPERRAAVSKILWAPQP